MDIFTDLFSSEEFHLRTAIYFTSRLFGKKGISLSLLFFITHFIWQGIDDLAPISTIFIGMTHLKVLISASQILTFQIYFTTCTLNSPPFLMTIFYFSSLAAFLKIYQSTQARILIWVFFSPVPSAHQTAKVLVSGKLLSNLGFEC